MPCPGPVPAACRLSGVERAAASAEETDIDAVELPLPGADILDFSRGVTDLDAVGKEVGATPSPGPLPAALRGWHGPGPTALTASPGPRGREGLSSIPQLQIKGICRCRAALWLGPRGESCPEAQLCAATRKGFGAEPIETFFHQNHKNKKTFLIQ